MPNLPQEHYETIQAIVEAVTENNRAIIENGHILRDALRALTGGLKMPEINVHCNGELLASVGGEDSADEETPDESEEAEEAEEEPEAEEGEEPAGKPIDAEEAETVLDAIERLEQRLEARRASREAPEVSPAAIQ